jgi:hypothetical protein
MAQLLASAAFLLLARVAAAASTPSSWLASGCQSLSVNVAKSYCPVGLIAGCVASGYNFVWDAAGNVIFAPLIDPASVSSCRSYLGSATGGNALAGNLVLNDEYGGSYTATYTTGNVTVSVPDPTQSAGSTCPIVFDRGSCVADSNFAPVGSLTYASSTCASPSPCFTGGMNWIADGFSRVAFLSKDANAFTDECSAYIGVATPTVQSAPLDAGTVQLIYSAGGPGYLTPVNGGVTVTYSTNSVVVTPNTKSSNCTMTFTRPAGAVAYVTSVAQLTGYTTATFGTAQAAAFAMAMAAQLSVLANAVTITGVTTAPGRRHLAAGSVNVAFSVATTAGGLQALTASVQAARSGSASTLAALKSAGLTACTSVSLVAPASSTAPPVPTSSLPVTTTLSPSTSPSSATRASVTLAATALVSLAAMAA